MESIEKTEVKNELALVVEQSGIEKSKGEIISKTLNEFFVKAKGWNDTISSLQIDDVSEVGKMKMAKEGRLTLKNQRLACKKLVEEKRLEVKAKMADYVLEDKLWLKSFQMVEATYKNLESKLEEKEKYAERKEAERLELLEKERISKLIPLSEFCSIELMNLKTMPEDDFKSAHEKAQRLFDIDKKEKERIEKERIEKEKAEAEERQRIRLENEKLKAEAEKKKLRDSKRNKELQPYIIFIRDYDKMLNLPEADYKKELIEIDKGAKEHYKYEEQQRVKKQKEAKALADKLESERKAKEIAFKKANEEKDRLAKALKAKQEAEELEKKRIEELEAKKIKEEREASLAPQKEKIKVWVNSFIAPDLNRTGLDKLSNEKVDEIISKFEAFKKWAVEESKLIK